MYDTGEDTIAAISTAPSPSGIGIIRISGNDAIATADRMYRESMHRPGKKLADQKPNTVHHGYVTDRNGKVIDEVLVILMKAPHSYTGEDTVEIDCHGGILAERRILEEAIRCGARLAEPGEFTKRAFLNGRMDLSQAESVMDVISARNDMALRSAEQQLEGSLSAKTKEIRQALLHQTARIEAAIDDPEHMSLDGCAQEIEGIVRNCRSEIKKLIDSADSGRYISEGMKTVITGKPNAGKSSVLNFLLGEDRAIVTDIAGTTRDILEETLNIRGITLRLLDTAGIRHSEDVIEQIGVEKAAAQMKNADLVLYVVDGSVPLDENDSRILNLIRDQKVIVIMNKNDLEHHVSEEDLRKCLTQSFGEKGGTIPVITMSAHEKTGLDALESAIEQMFFSGKTWSGEEICVTNERHAEALREADRSLSLVLDSIQSEMPEDFWSIDLMGACEALGKITGETAGEDLVNEIFSKFCMGK